MQRNAQSYYSKKSKSQGHKERENDKEKILKVVEVNKFLPYKGRLKADFSSETMEARRQWDNIFNVLKKEKKIKRESYVKECNLLK